MQQQETPVLALGKRVPACKKGQELQATPSQHWLADAEQPGRQKSALRRPSSRSKCSSSRRNQCLSFLHLHLKGLTWAKKDPATKDDQDFPPTPSQSRS
ncbi:hypothetical protein Y1Q_0012325 [Alligator mississippiensis]|uniref:Uncharacterized protein n=1 Tax=Alligator mississippiensis TaxID=8496 RepID=A0A151M570_ALLMI|nr:hypothetical protein Y1Q_0012325 [Alligator mississippiensis]